MGVAISVVATLVASGCFALLAVRANWFGLVNRPRASLAAAVFGAVLAVGVVMIQVAAPLMSGGISYALLPLIATDYFLAMGHNLMGGEYPFFWTPLWVFRIGSLTPLIPAGAAFALAAGYSVRMHGRSTAPLTLPISVCALFTHTPPAPSP